MKILSFDIGGSKTAWALADEKGKIMSEVKTLPTPKTADEIIDILKAVAAENNFDGFALATAGVVMNNKLAGKPNNLPEGYENINLSDIFKVPFAVENDANAAMWAEYKIGNLQGVSHGIMLTLGTDVGCGIICNGQILRGKCGAAGEVCFDCSGRSLRRISADAGSKETDCFVIHDLACREDGAERVAYKKWQENLLGCIRTLNQILDTEVVTLSGSLAKIVDYAVVNSSIKLLQRHNHPLIKPALCGTNAGIIGAALLCAEKMKG